MTKKAAKAKKPTKGKAPAKRGRKPGPKKDATLCVRAGCKRKKDANHSEFCTEHAAERAAYMQAYMRKKREAAKNGTTYYIGRSKKEKAELKAGKKAKKSVKSVAAKKPTKKPVIKGKKLAKSGAKAKSVRKPNPIAEDHPASISSVV